MEHGQGEVQTHADSFARITLAGMVADLTSLNAEGHEVHIEAIDAAVAAVDAVFAYVVVVVSVAYAYEVAGAD